MNRFYFFLGVLLIGFLSSCGKEEIAVFGESDLIGIWISADHTTQYSIENTKGKGNLVRFTEYEINHNRLLKIEFPLRTFTYKIRHINDTSMTLVDTADVEKDFIKIR